MKSYKEYKEIEIKDIKGCNYIAITVANLDKICLQRDAIRKHGIGQTNRSYWSRKWIQNTKRKI